MTVILSRTPFTLCMLLLLATAGFYGGTHLGSLDHNVNRSVGYSVRHLFEGQWHRLFTSLFFTAGGSRFYASLVMFTICVGWVECRYGTRIAVLAFFGIHFVTLLTIGIAVVLPLALVGTERGQMLFNTPDVGPSAGYYGCLGLAVISYSGKVARGIAILIIGILLLRLVWSTIYAPEQGRMMSADMAHLLAFFMGLATHRWLPAPARIVEL